MAEKLAWGLFGMALVCTVGAAFTGPLRLEAVSVICAVIAVALSLFGIYFAFAAWKDET